MSSSTYDRGLSREKERGESVRRLLVLLIAAVAAIAVSSAAASSGSSIAVTSQSSGSVTLTVSASQKDASQSSAIEVLCQDGTDQLVAPSWTHSGGSLVDTVTFSVSTTPGVSCQATLDGPGSVVYAVKYFSTV